MSNYVLVLPDELYHHGIKGQKWGVRRFQYADGSLTKAGWARYGYGTKTSQKANYKIDKDFKKYHEAHKKRVDANKRGDDKGERDEKEIRSTSKKLASTIQKQLNDIDQFKATSDHARGVVNERLSAVNKKLKKLSNKEQTDKVKAKVEKLQRKKQFEEDSLVNIEERKKDATILGKSLVDEYSSMGFDISSRTRERTVSIGRQAAAYAIAGIPGVLIYEHGSIAKGHANTREGTQYKVRYNH